MARSSISFNVRTITYPRVDGSSHSDHSRPDYRVTNVGGVADIGTQASTVASDLATISTDAATMHTQYGSIQASLTTLITAIGAGTGSAQAQALLTLVNTGSTDLATLVADVATGTSAANAMSSASTVDLSISVNTANVVRIGQMKSAFDAAITLAQGGWGGMTK